MDNKKLEDSLDSPQRPLCWTISREQIRKDPTLGALRKKTERLILQYEKALNIRRDGRPIGTYAFA